MAWRGSSGSREPPASALSVPMHVLTARQRLVLRLLFDESRTVAEAARFLDVDEQTVRSTKHKALSRLRAEMDPSSAPIGGDAGP